MPQVTVRYFASARAATGLAQESFEAATLGQLLSGLRGRHGERLGRILDGSSLLLDGLHVSDPLGSMPDGAQVDVLPPFAGG